MAELTAVENMCMMADPTYCPKCGAEGEHGVVCDPAVQFVAIDGSKLAEDCKCKSCGAEFHAIYKCVLEEYHAGPWA